MNKTNRIIACILMVFIALSAIISLILPDREYSESEKRELMTKPGSFSEFDTYASDQFFARDAWVSLKGSIDYLLGARKINDVYYAGGRFMRDFKVNEERLRDNLEAIKKLADKSDIPVHLLLVPEAVAIYEDTLPPFAEPDNQDELAAYIKSELIDVNVIWPKDVLAQHKDEQIYFNTDHHWTPRGALYAYNELAKSLGREMVKMPEFEVLSDDFRGSMRLKAGLPFGRDELTKPEGVENEDFAVVINNGEREYDGKMFDMAHIESDPYRVYQGGDHPIMAVASKAGEGSALVIKDSFFNVMLPYMAQDYKTVYVTDTRYNRGSQAQYAADMQVDEIILVYSLDSLVNEYSITYLAN